MGPVRRSYISWCDAQGAQIARSATVACYRFSTEETFNPVVSHRAFTRKGHSPERSSNTAALPARNRHRLPTAEGQDPTASHLQIRGKGRGRR
eukprot:6218690-Prymnesium_polylepis.2